MSDTTHTNFATATSDDGFTVSSTSETVEQISEALKPEPEPEAAEPEPEREPDPKLSKAASKLGKAGGEAAAAKRAEAKAAEEAEAEGGTSEEDDIAAAEQAEKEGKLGKPRHDAKARMLQKAREAKALKEEVARERQERARLAAELEQLRAGKAPAKAEEAKAADRAPASGPEKPKAEDFQTYEEFVEAVADWKADQRLQRYQAESQQQARAAARHERINTAMHTFFGRMDEAFKADPSMEESTKAVAAQFQPSFTLRPDEPLQPLNVAADEIISSEHGPALMLHFRDHPDEIQRFRALPNPFAVQREIAKLEGRLSAAPTATAPRAEVSKARPPVRPVAGAPYTADAAPDPDASSFDEHLRFYNAKERRAR